MTRQQKRELFIKTFEEYPIFMLQGSVGERIKRKFTHRNPSKPLGLAGHYYTEDGHQGLDTVFHDYLGIADKYNLPMILHPYCRVVDPELIKGEFYEMRNISQDNFNHCRSIVDGYVNIREKIFIGTILNNYGDPYLPSTALGEEEAYIFHSKTASLIDLMDYDHARTGLSSSISEATGAARALSDTSLPYFVSFLVQKNGKLLDGTWLHDAIAYIDMKTEKRPPLFYQVNCVHPRNMMKCLDQTANRTELVRSRFRGLEANGSDLSPGELDNADLVYTSPPKEWADDMIKLHEDYGIKILGGCCGTDHSHMEELAIRIRHSYDKLGIK